MAICVHLLSASQSESAIRLAVVVSKVRTSLTTLPSMTRRRQATTVALCTSRAQQRGYRTCITPPDTPPAWGPSIKVLYQACSGAITALGDSLGCSRSPGSNLYSGLTAPGEDRPRCRRTRWQSSSVSFAVGRSASAGGQLVWGAFCQGGSARVLSIFIVGFLVRSESPFPRPDHAMA